MRTFEVGSLIVEVGNKESAQGTIPSCGACKATLLTGTPYICLRPDGFLATRPKYPTYFCQTCWRRVVAKLAKEQ